MWHKAGESLWTKACQRCGIRQGRVYGRRRVRGVDEGIPEVWHKAGDSLWTKGCPSNGIRRVRDVEEGMCYLRKGFKNYGIN